MHLKKSFVFLLVIIFLFGCKQTNIHDKIHQRFYNMPSYSTKCTVTITSNKTKNTYDVDAVYDAEGNRYRIDTKDFSVVVGKNGGIIINGSSSHTIPTKDGDMLMLINRFFESYYTGESSQKTTNTPTDTTMLECGIVNPPEYAKTMKLWINNKTIMPVKMAVYNKQQKEIILVEFKQFNILNKVDEKKFTN